MQHRLPTAGRGVLAYVENRRDDQARSGMPSRLDPVPFNLRPNRAYHEGEGHLLAACRDRSCHHTTRIGGTTASLELQHCAPGTASGKYARTSMTDTLPGPATRSLLLIIR